jgi:TP901 family phage tail tape measure protein
VNGLNTLNNQVSNLSNTFKAATPAAAVLTAAAAGIGTGLFAATQAATSFEQAMADVRAVMTPSEAQNFGQALGDLAIQLGKDTVFSAREAAAGIGELIRAGISAPDVLNGAAAAALHLAAATGISVADAATVAAQTMNAFGKTADQLGGVVDTLAGTANATAATMSDLKFGLEVVSATAQTMGLSFEDTSAAIGLFVSAGQNGSTAGTGLRQMLLELIPTTKPAANEMKKLGLLTADGGNAFFDATGHVKSLADIAGVLEHALRGMSDEEKIAALNTLFTRDAINSASILARTGAKGVAQLTGEIAKISAADTAAVRLGTLQGALNNLGSSFETVQILVGNLFIPVLHDLANQTRTLVDSFSTLSPEAQKFLVGLAGVAGIILGAVGGFVLLGAAVAFLAPSFAALIRLLPLMAAIFGPIGIVVAALATDFLGLRTAISNAFGRLQPILGNFGLAFDKLVNGDIQGAIDTFQATLGALLPQLAPSFVGIRGFIESFVRDVVPILSNFGLVLQKLFGGDVAGAFDTFRAILGALSPVLGEFAGVIAQVAGAISGPVGVFFTTVVPAIAAAVGSFAAGAGEGFRVFFTETLPPIIATIASFAGDVGAGLLDFFNTKIVPIAEVLGRFAGDVGAGLLNFFTVTLPPILENVAGFAGDVGAGLLVFFQTNLPIVADTAGRFAGDIGAGLSNFFTVVLPPILTAIQGFTADLAAGFVTFFRDELPVVAAGIDLFAAHPADALRVFFGEVVPLAVAQAATWTTDTTAALVDFFQNKAPLIVQGMEKFTPASVQTLLAFFTQFDTIRTQVESLGPIFQALGNFFTAFATFQQALVGLEQRTVGAVFDALLPSIQNFANAVGPSAGPIQAVGESIGTLGSALSGATAFIQNAATALNNLAAAINAIDPNQLPIIQALALLFGGRAAAVPGTAPLPPGVEGPTFQRAAFNLAGGAAGGQGAPLIAIGQLIISTEAEAEAFLKRMADAVRGSAGRVNQPPENEGNPALVPQFT